MCFEDRVCRNCRIELQIPDCTLDLQTWDGSLSRGRVRPFGTGQRTPTRAPATAQGTVPCSPRFLTATATAHFVPHCNPKLQFGPVRQWPAVSLPLATTIPYCKTRLQFAAKDVFKAQVPASSLLAPASRAKRSVVVSRRSAPGCWADDIDCLSAKMGLDRLDRRGDDAL
jgi:hypothetical protein